MIVAIKMLVVLANYYICWYMLAITIIAMLDSKILAMLIMQIMLAILAMLEMLAIS